MTLEYKNSTIHYTISGKGLAIVLLHGFLETVEMWNVLIPELSKNHKVICIDLLGHGQTDCIGYVHTMDDMADVVLEVLNHLRINEAHFIGHSMGGYVALALAEKQSQLFKGLCLMNSTFESDNIERKAIRTRANKLAQTHFETLIALSFANLFASKSRIKFKNEYDTALDLALQISVQGYIAAQEGMKLRQDKFDLLNHLDCKRLIIIGEKDTIINKHSIVSKIKDTSIKYIIFSEGHMSYIENKSELSYELLLFIEK